VNNEWRASIICTVYCNDFEMKECEMGGTYGVQEIGKKSYKMFETLTFEGYAHLGE
jgi:hypothetical protein